MNLGSPNKPMTQDKIEKKSGKNHETQDPMT